MNKSRAEISKLGVLIFEFFFHYRCKYIARCNVDQPAWAQIQEALNKHSVVLDFPKIIAGTAASSHQRDIVTTLGLEYLHLIYPSVIGRYM